ncbi:hypothetical protein JW752_05275 [Candidatus Peregrinibacteria bacterium]|nr:hypothetical protein [Candidatus Peregrinibacteria bacterium]
MPPQKGKILNWVLFLLFIVAVFGVLVFLQKRAGAPEAPLTPPPVAEEGPGKPGKEFATPQLTEREKKRMDNEALSKAIQTGAGCEAIQFDAEARQQCEDTLAYNEALKKNDEKLCRQISDEVLKIKCLDALYSRLAIQALDAELCRKIDDEVLQQECLDRIQATFGRTAKSAATCEGIEDKTLRQSCLDNFYYSRSVETLSKESCNQIISAELKDRCVKSVAKSTEVLEVAKAQTVRTYQSHEETLKTCTTDACKDDANYNLALVKKDLSYCNAITDEDRQGQCIKTQTVSINTYYLRMAMSKKDASLCDKILDSTLRSACLLNIQ